MLLSCFSYYNYVVTHTQTITYYMNSVVVGIPILVVISFFSVGSTKVVMTGVSET